MKLLIVVLSSASLAFGASAALAQSSDTTKAPDAKAEAKAKKKQQFEQTEKSMQQQSTSSAAGAVPGANTDKTVPKNRPGGKAGMEMQQEQQMFKGSKPVDKTAKAPPRPNASKMTPEERQKYREEAVKEMKP
jgi:hypothetical protein